MVDGGEQAPGARDAVTVTGSPPEISSIVAGETTGAKSAALTFTTKLVAADGPLGSLTRTFTTFCPGRAPARAETSKVDGPGRRKRADRDRGSA